MKSFIKLTDFKKSELFEIFRIADSIEQYEGFLKGSIMQQILLTMGFIEGSMQRYRNTRNNKTSIKKDVKGKK